MKNKEILYFDPRILFELFADDVNNIFLNINPETIASFFIRLRRLCFFMRYIEKKGNLKQNFMLSNIKYERELHFPNNNDMQQIGTQDLMTVCNKFVHSSCVLWDIDPDVPEHERVFQILCEDGFVYQYEIPILSKSIQEFFTSCKKNWNFLKYTYFCIVFSEKSSIFFSDQPILNEKERGLNSPHNIIEYFGSQLAKDTEENTLFKQKIFEYLSSKYNISLSGKNHQFSNAGGMVLLERNLEMRIFISPKGEPSYLSEMIELDICDIINFLDYIVKILKTQNELSKLFVSKNEK